MNIVFLTHFNVHDVKEWSGTVSHMYQTLLANHNVYPLGANIGRMVHAFSAANFTNKRNLSRYRKSLGRLYDDFISALAPIDLVFFGEPNISGALSIDLPKVYISDVTSKIFREEYKKDYSQTLAEDALEYDFLHSFESLIYPTSWIAERVIKEYAIQPNKIHIVEFGANIPHPAHYQIDMPNDICQIVFIGRHWKEKGGDIAFETYQQLQERGVPCHITFIGCTPPEEVGKDEGTTVFPFLDKSKPAELQQFCDILYHSHFLLLPTRFDAFGIAFAEASAYGVPSIGTRVGGTPQVVRDGKNGYLLPLEAGAEKYADKIMELWSAPEQYRALRLSSRKEYETRLNWDVWLERVNKIFEETLADYKKKNGNGTV